MSKEIRIVEVEGCRLFGGYKASITTVSKDGMKRTTRPLGKFQTRDAARDTGIHFLVQTEPKGE